MESTHNESFDDVKVQLGLFMVESRTAIGSLSREMQSFKAYVQSYLETSKAMIQQIRQEGQQWRDMMDQRIQESRPETEKKIEENCRESQQWQDKMDQTIREIRQEGQQWRDSQIQIIRDMRRQRGDLANRMGTLVEDIFFPSFPQAIETTFSFSLNTCARNVTKKKDGKYVEYDIVGVCEEHQALFIVEIKSNPNRVDSILEFQKKIQELPFFLSEYASYKVYPIYGGLSMSEETLTVLKKEGIYGIWVRGDLLEILPP